MSIEEVIAGWRSRAIAAGEFSVETSNPHSETYAEAEAETLSQCADEISPEVARLTAERDKWLDAFNRSEQFQNGPTVRAEKAEAEVARLAGLLNSPEIHDFAVAVVLEAAHQRERWDVDGDAGKTDADWFWLLGYLGGKALFGNATKDYSLSPKEFAEKQLHRIVTIGAAAANWHAYKSGASTAMRPGIAPPSE